jgi:signal transduction histidine kinase
MQLAPDISKCAVDASQFNAAILNLVVNARDAMPAGGESAPINIGFLRTVPQTSPARRTFVFA